MKCTPVNHRAWVVGLVVWLGAALPALAQKTNPPAKLAINDSFMPTQQLLFSDGNSVNHPELGAMYVDWRLASGDPCVNGWVKPDGFFFIYTHRGNDLGAGCEQNFPAATHRRYILKFPDSVICSALGFASAPCEVGANRIRAESLFRKNAQETSVAFMFTLGGGSSYTVNTAGDITVIPPPPTPAHSLMPLVLPRSGETPWAGRLSSPSS